jgi:hypothetical protein
VTVVCLAVALWKDNVGLRKTLEQMARLRAIEFAAREDSKGGLAAIRELGRASNWLRTQSAERDAGVPSEQTDDPVPDFTYKGNLGV